jgi:hypothetical protein
LLDYEKPDLIANTGDVIAADSWDGVTKPWARLQWEKMADQLQSEGYFWASTAGDKDS